MAITDLSQLDLNGTYTYADYLTWQVKERIELLKEKSPWMSPAPNLQHQRIVTHLSAFFDYACLEATLPRFVAPLDVRLPAGESPRRSSVHRGATRYLHGLRCFQARCAGLQWCT